MYGIGFVALQAFIKDLPIIAGSGRCETISDLIDERFAGRMSCKLSSLYMQQRMCNWHELLELLFEASSALLLHTLAKLGLAVCDLGTVASEVAVMEQIARCLIEREIQRRNEEETWAFFISRRPKRF